MTQNILDIPQMLLKKGLPFAIYSLPDSGTFTLIFQKEHTLNATNIGDLNNVSGFVIANFNSAQTRMANIIKPEFLLTENDNPDEALSYLNTLSDIDEHNLLENISISKSDYLDRTSYLINKLNDSDLKKIVFSRVIRKNLNTELIIKDLINKLKAKYTDAFINLFHLPGVGTWCGASPETLLKVVDNSFITEALAGTRLANENNGNPLWSMKEREEQQLVSEFIESLLSELGIHNYKKTGPVSIEAGAVVHLQTKFEIPITSQGQKEGKLIAGLHPTPAVCGLPKADAFLLIQKAEQHQRRYYTGFLGPWNLANESQLFVNLRCAELDKKKINIYVGGGLTAASNPEDEYLETVHKSKTMLSVMENL